MRRRFTKLGSDQEGATALEYAILGSMIAAVIAAVLALLGQSVAAMFQGALF